MWGGSGWGARKATVVKSSSRAKKSGFALRSKSRQLEDIRAGSAERHHIFEEAFFPKNREKKHTKKYNPDRERFDSRPTQNFCLFFFFGFGPLGWGRVGERVQPFLVSRS